MAAGNSIDTPTKRNNLLPRREPYWQKLKTGQYLGFRCTKTGGHWIARLTRDRKSTYQAIGDALTYDEAVERALEWCGHAAGVENPHYRVQDAINDYVEHLRVNNSENAAKDARQRLANHLTDKLKQTELVNVRTSQLKQWHQSLVRLSDDPEDVRRSKDGANKILTKLKAALNLAFRSGLAPSDREWRRVTPFRDVGGTRALFLTDKQVKALLKHAEGGFRLLLEAAKLTGARYGELAAAKVADLESRERRLHLNGKTGPRYCYLSDGALTWFKRQARGKRPDAWLLSRDDGERWGKSHQSRPMKEAVSAARLPRETVFYSLRHFYISKALLAGVPIQMVAENCGTSIRMIEKHYGKFLAHDRRNFLNQVKLG